MALNQKKRLAKLLAKIIFTWDNLSLIKKVMLVFAPVFFCFFLIVGLITERILVAQIVKNMEESIRILTIDEAKDIDDHFKRLEALGYKSAKIIQKWINNSPAVDPKV